MREGSHRNLSYCRRCSRRKGKKNKRKENLRSGDDHFGVNELFVKGRVLTLLVRGGDESVAIVLEPLADAELVLGSTEHAGLLGSMLTTLMDE